MLLLEDVSLGYADRTVLSGFSLSLKAGERVGIIGPSGVGKTSILQTVADLLPIRKGSARNQFSCVGYVFQEPRLLPWLRVRDNLIEPLMAKGVKRSDAIDNAHHWLKKLQLDPAYWNSYPSALSGGMAQRVSLARAFAMEPDLLLLDEPFSALDPALRHELTELCDALLKDLNCALIYVCHHPEELSALTDRCLLLRDETTHEYLSLDQEQNFSIDTLLAQWGSKL